MLRVSRECHALLTVAGEPMESAAQSVLAAAEGYRLMPTGSAPLQKRALSVPCLCGDQLCSAGSCNDSSPSALPAAATEAKDLSTRSTCIPTSGEFLCWRWQQLQPTSPHRCRAAPQPSCSMVVCLHGLQRHTLPSTICWLPALVQCRSCAHHTLIQQLFSYLDSTSARWLFPCLLADFGARARRLSAWTVSNHLHEHLQSLCDEAGCPSVLLCAGFHRLRTAVRPGSCSDLAAAAVGEAGTGAPPSPAMLSLPPHAVSVLAQRAAAADGRAGLSCSTAASGAVTGSEHGSGAGTPLAELPCHSDAESAADSEAARQGKQTPGSQGSPERAASLPACVSSVCSSDDGRSCMSRSDSEGSAILAAAAAEAAATSGLALGPALEHPLAVPGLPFDAETRSYLVVSLLGPQLAVLSLPSPPAASAAPLPATVTCSSRPHPHLESAGVVSSSMLEAPCPKWLLLPMLVMTHKSNNKHCRVHGLSTASVHMQTSSVLPDPRQKGQWLPQRAEDPHKR